MEPKIENFGQYFDAYQASVENPDAFWAGVAEEFTWRKKWDKVLEWDFSTPEIKWFEGGKLNITENCLDRHLEDKGEQTAILWEPNDPKQPAQHISYRDLHERVCKMANVLKNNGIGKGDNVCIYLPMIPELAVSLLACARIGAVHSVVFAGFSAQALADRANDAGAKMIITSDASYRGKKEIGLKKIVDGAMDKAPDVEKCLVVKHTGTSDIAWKEGRDLWMHDELAKVNAQCPAEEMDAEDRLFILYTSGSTGKPKGMVHTTAGYMVYTNYTFRNAFQYQPGEVYWCTADIGWITGHSYIVYGPLSAGATTLMFEGVPSYPDMGRFWEIVEKHKVNIFYTAPTAIRSLEKSDLSLITDRDLSSLRVLGTVGEPINEEAWNWYEEHIGDNRCPIVDTYWQTETGGFMIAPIAGVTPTKPTYATLPMPGIQPALIDEKGTEIKGNAVEGRLTFKFPWPAMARTISGDHKRFKDTYFSYDGFYFTGDGARRDYEGYYRITGRVDDVIIVSGHNIGSAEVENAIDEHPMVNECAVVGFPHDMKGNSIYAYINLYHDVDDENELRKEIIEAVSRSVGPIAKPEKIQFVHGLPKTRSGKIMRRILRKIAHNDTGNLGDTSSLLDPTVVDDIKENALV